MAPLRPETGPQSTETRDRTSTSCRQDSKYQYLIHMVALAVDGESSSRECYSIIRKQNQWFISLCRRRREESTRGTTELSNRIIATAPHVIAST